MEYILAPSMLSCNFLRAGEDLETIDRAGAQWVHLDVMDGIFVPNMSFAMPVIKSLRGGTERFFDVHLMIVEPERYIKEFKDAGAEMICFHIEATKDVSATVDLIHAQGCKAGIAVKPGTPIEAVYPYLEQVEMVLIMTVEPGFGGQKYIQECTDKIRKLRETVTERGLNLYIQVDGGIDSSNVSVPLEAGANVIVAGSAVFKNDVAANVKAIMEQFPNV